MKPFAALAFLCLTAFASDLPSPNAPLYVPDPCSVQRYGPAYRYPQAGWIFLHIEGEPYERGFQHGKLLSKEIADYLHCMAMCHSNKTPGEAWHSLRTLVNSILLRRFEKEYLEEMQGIADGAKSNGAKILDRPVDLVDIVTANTWAELMMLDGALHAWPTGLEDIQFKDSSKGPVPHHPERCSAFAATGPATADGKIVLGHITMYELYPSSFFNVWIDLKPTKGHRISMQSYPAGIQSGVDYYVNSAGLIVVETTISQTQFDPNGMSNTSQIRKAVQYGGSIDEFVNIMKNNSNGLYSNEWLIGDTKTNEIAMFEMGTHKSKLYRSSKNEWFGGTEGFYWGCNNTKDREVRLETVASINDRPQNMIYRPHDRDRVWVQLYNSHKGRIDADFGREAFTTAPLASFTSVDAKFTTTDMAKDMKSYAMFGPPMGRSWQPAPWEREKFPAVRPMLTNPWTVIHSNAPAQSKEPLATDLGGPRHEEKVSGGDGNKPGWHGTIFPKNDADTWLAVSFAEYERFFSREFKQIESAKDHCLCDADKRQSLRDLYGPRANYLLFARDGDVALKDIRVTSASDAWYHLSAGKGFMLMHELRGVLGEKAFLEAMKSFGAQNAGKEVSTADFQAHVEKSSGKDLKAFFERWMNAVGLPKLKLETATMREGKQGEKKYVVEGSICAEGGRWPMFLDVTVETAEGEFTQALTPESAGHMKLESDQKPARIIVDKYERSAIANGSFYSIGSFMRDIKQTLIVYGTLDEESANAEAAEELQTALIRRGWNYSVPIRSDRTITDDEIRQFHLLLIGRPACNRISRMFEKEFPIAWGSNSFRVGKESFAGAMSGVAAVALNPLNQRNMLVLIAGLNAAGTYALAPRIGYGEGGGELSIFENGGGAKTRTHARKELVKEF